MTAKPEVTTFEQWWLSVHENGEPERPSHADARAAWAAGRASMKAEAVVAVRSGGQVGSILIVEALKP